MIARPVSDGSSGTTDEAINAEPPTSSGNDPIPPAVFNMGLFPIPEASNMRSADSEVQLPSMQHSTHDRNSKEAAISTRDTNNRETSAW